MAIIDKPSVFMNTVLYTGNSGSGDNVVNVNFQPDFTWFKSRTQAYPSYLIDAVRGDEKYLNSSNNNAEASWGVDDVTWTSTGFTLNTTGGSGINEGGQGANNMVAWNWKAGTSVSGDTTGSGTLKTYTGSVNTTSGFSIIKYTGNGTAGHTIPHHLGVAPSAIFVKKLNELGDWSSYHSVLGNAGYMRLNNTNAFATASTYWNNTSPTSSVFTTGTTGNINGSGSTYIAYCFAEKQGYSKFGSYTGNGSTDGTFIYTGFKPAFVMIKKTSGTGSWYIYDNKRDVSNAMTRNLFPDGNYVEDNNTNNDLDFLSNGFKIRTVSGARNASGATYIYMAFAENPFVASNFVPATAR